MWCPKSALVFQPLHESANRDLEKHPVVLVPVAISLLADSVPVPPPLTFFVPFSPAEVAACSVVYRVHPSAVGIYCSRVPADPRPYVGRRWRPAILRSSQPNRRHQ